MSPVPLRAQRSFAPDPRSVAEARRFVRAQLEDWGAVELQESAALAVSELVTNALVHTGTAARVEVRLEPHSMRLEVEDRHPDRALPTGRLPAASDESESGRGLMITSSLASSWGVEYTPTAKRVWLTVDRDQPPAPGPSGFPDPATVTAGGAAVAVVEVAGDGTVTGWNADATTLFGWPATEVVGKSFRDLVDPVPGERPPEGTPAHRRTRWQGTYALLTRDGPPVRVFGSHQATARGDGWVLLLVPEARRGLLEQVVAAAPVQRTESDPLGLRDDTLLRLGVQDYLALAVERVRDAVAADGCYLMLAHDLDDAFEVAAVSGLPDDVRGTRLLPSEAGMLDGRTPHLPVVVPDDAASLVRPLTDTPLRSVVVVPVVAEGRVIGALAAASEHRDGFSDDQSALLQRLADSLALAADRARLQASERERRGWLSFVAEAGDLLAASLDQEMTMAITGQIVVPRIASWCAVHLDDERGHPVLHQVWHADEDRVEPLRRVLEKAEPEEVRRLPDEHLDDEVATLRLVARGRQIGFLTLGRPAGNPLRDDVRLVADSIARRAALAIDNARAHGALQATGRALQNSLLPPSLPDTPGLEVGVVYEAAGEGTAAGGDFYDLFPVGGGTWCFVVGDVCGTGAEAAAVTGLARHTIRALTRAGFPLAPMLERLNDAILDEGERSRFLTLVCGMLRPDGRRVHLTMVNAGHPGPFLVGGDGAVRQIGMPQPLLGVMDRVAYVAEGHVLERGDLLVTVTDGVLERRDGLRMIDDDGLAAVLARSGGLPAQAVAERVRRLVVDFTDQPQRDDMAILALRVASS